MKLALKENLPEEKVTRIIDLIPGEIFIDSDNDYCMKIDPEYDESGRLITAVAVSGISIGALLEYDEESRVIPVNAELHILGRV